MGGLLPFSWESMDAYCRLMGEVLVRSDVRIIEAIEEEFFESRAAAEDRRSKAEERKRSEPDRSGRRG
jgi:hypothetical protein